MSVSKARPSRRKTILTENEKFKLASKKFQKFVTLYAETGMAKFDRKMKFLDDVLVKWEEDKESQLVTNEPATVIDDATIQDDLGCELLNQGEEVAEIQDDVRPDLYEEPHQLLEQPQETSINLEQVVLPTKMRNTGHPKVSNKTAIGLPKKRKCTGLLSTLTLKRVESGHVNRHLFLRVLHVDHLFTIFVCVLFILVYLYVYGVAFMSS